MRRVSSCARRGGSSRAAMGRAYVPAPDRVNRCPSASRSDDFDSVVCVAPEVGEVEGEDRPDPGLDRAGRDHRVVEGAAGDTPGGRLVEEPRVASRFEGDERTLPDEADLKHL